MLRVFLGPTSGSTINVAECIWTLACPLYILNRRISSSKGKGKGKVHPRTGHEDPEE